MPTFEVGDIAIFRTLPGRPKHALERLFSGKTVKVIKIYTDYAIPLCHVCLVSDSKITTACVPHRLHKLPKKDVKITLTRKRSI